MEPGDQVFLAKLKELRREAASKFDDELRAKTLVGLDEVIHRIAKSQTLASAEQTAYCGLQVNMTVSEGPAREEATALAAEAAALVRSLGEEDGGKRDEAAGRIQGDQATMSVSMGPACTTSGSQTAAEARAILRALTRNSA